MRLELTLFTGIRLRMLFSGRTSAILKDISEKALKNKENLTKERKRSIIKWYVALGSAFFQRTLSKASNFFSSINQSFNRRKTMNGFKRFGAFASAIVLAALGLAACGGGGGGGFTSVPTTPSAAQPHPFAAPVIPAAQAPEPAKAVAKAAKPLAQQPTDPWGGRDPWTVTNELFDKVAEVSFTQYFPDHRATNQYEQYWYRYYPTTGCYVGVDMNTAGVHVLGCSFGNLVVYVGQLGDFYPPTPPTYTLSWYSPPVTATVNHMGHWVVGANQLPAGCTEITQQCWKDSVQNGTVKFIETSAKMVGLSNGRDIRPIVFAYYITENSQLWNARPFYADTGEPISGPSLNGGVTDSIEKTWGNEMGIITLAAGSCWQKKWYPAGDPSGNANIWANEPTACPAE